MVMLVPLIKKTQHDPKDLVNYRPISNLPFLSKILEKVVSSQLYSLEKKMVSVRIFSQDLNRFIVLRLLSLELQMTCSYHLIVVVSLY